MRDSWLRYSFLVVAALLLLNLGFVGHAFAFYAPTTPTFQLAWGKLGTGPGQFNAPWGAAADTLGNVYVIDRNNARVEKFDYLGNYLMSIGGMSVPLFVAVAPGVVYVGDNSGVKEFDPNGNLILQFGSAGSGNGQFSFASGVALDGAGNIFVADYFLNRVQKFTIAGVYVSQWGSVGAGNGQFNNPTGMCCDAAGNVYVVDESNNRVQEFTNAGVYVTQWGTQGSGNGQFAFPSGIAIDALGNFYVTDENNSRVEKFSHSLAYLAQFGVNGNSSGQFVTPAGVAVDPAGNVYVADTGNNRMQKFSGAGVGIPQPAEAFTLTWGSQGTGAGQFSYPLGLAADGAGEVFVIDESLPGVKKFSSAGVYLTQWGSPGGAGDGIFNQPFFIAADAGGNVYVSDENLCRIQKFDSNGTFLLKWGTAGSGNGQFEGPNGVATDAAGNVYVVDSGNNRIEKFSSSGAYLTQWGSQGSGDGQFIEPISIAVDPAGSVYVVDFDNDRVEKFSSTGGYLAKWSTQGANPYAIAADPMGNIYVSDTITNTIAKYTSNGVLLYQWGTQGTATGQFHVIQGLGSDGAGNLYVVDHNNYRVQKFTSLPAITIESDVANDQGHRTRLRFQRLTADTPGSGMSVLGYDVFLLAEVPGSNMIDPLVREQSTAAVSYVVPATGASTYTANVGSVIDATMDSTWYSGFFVRAYTSAGTFDSELGYGFSIDNIPPPAPSPFNAAYLPTVTHLQWGVSSASDFATFRLYRGASPNFTPATGNLIAATTDTGYVDATANGSYYKISAVDQDGNESAFAQVGPGVTVSAPKTPLAFALEAARPNPASARELSVRFALPLATSAHLELLDVAGRRLVTRDVGAMGAGEHVVNLADGTRLRAGVYLIRLTQGANRKVERVAVIDN